MKHKKLFVTCMVIFSVLVALGTFILIWFWGDSYPDFKEFSDTEVSIPGLKDDSVPQGLATYNAEYGVTDADGNSQIFRQDYFFVSSYMKKGASRIYVTGAKTGYVGYVTLKNVDGSDYTGHCGGVATNGDTLWVASGGKVLVAQCSDSAYRNIAYELIEKAKLANGENVLKFTSEFAANGSASFCFYYDAPDSTSDKLYVGEFYRKGDYETDSNHHIVTKNGEKQYAFVYEYSVTTDTSNRYGLSKLTDSKVAEADRVPKIDRIFSITDEIQGFARTDKGLVLSQSYGLKNSSILYYDWSSVYNNDNRSTYTSLTGYNFVYDGVKTVNDVQYTDTAVYVYHVDGNSLLRTYSVPSMSEGLCAIGNRVYVLFESGSYKYRAFVRMAVEHIYSFIPRS